MISIVISTLIVTSFGEQGWSYHGDTGPSNWPELFPVSCSGSRQSPIDIDKNATIFDESLATLSLDGYSQTLTNSTISNTGRTAEIVPNSEESYTISNGGLSGEYILVNLHFHWGCINLQGSEHTICGKQYSLEAHFVHRNVKYSTIEEALQHPDGLAALSVLFKVSKSPPNPAMTTITNALKSIRRPNTTTRFDLGSTVDSLLPPKGQRGFYRYNGSLTAPNCTEVVTWTVFAKPQTITPYQIEKFRKLLEKEDPKVPLVDNFRPTQPLNGRRILRSFRDGISYPRCQGKKYF